MFIALDGVACTSKTTILGKLARRHPELKVHFSDYYEYSKLYNFGSRQLTDPLIYTAIRVHEMNECEPHQIHVFDRSAISSIPYQHIFNSDLTEESVRRECMRLKNTPLMKPWEKTLILLSKPGQEEMLVNLMVTRGNGLDWQCVEYVERQNFFFRIWAEAFDYPTYEIDLTRSLNEQQEEIINILLKFTM